MSEPVISIDRAPPVGSIWVHRRTGRQVKIGEAPRWVARQDDAHPLRSMVWYKAITSPNGSHTALTKTPRDRFLKEYEPHEQRVARGATAAQAIRDAGGLPPLDRLGSSPAPWPQPINTSTLHTLALVIRARASAIVGDSYRRGDSKSTEPITRAMDEIADALDELAGEASFTIERSAFLGGTVERLLLYCGVAKSGEEARGHLAAGEVYLDGQRVTEDAPITTVTRERFTVRCGEKSAVVRVVG